MGAKRNKKPSRAEHPTVSGKKPRGGSFINVKASNFRWRTSNADHDGPFGWEATTIRHLLEEIVPKLHHFETMTWSQIEGANSHFVAFEDLCKEARDRLGTLDMENIENLFSLRLSGRERVWGHREGETFQVLWWDPEHLVCPKSQKRHLNALHPAARRRRAQGQSPEDQFRLGAGAKLPRSTQLSRPFGNRT